MSLLSWPALGSLAAGLGSVYLLWRLYPLRDRPGARWFLLTIAVQTVMCVAYAAALSVGSLPGLRWLLEVVTVSTLFWLGVPFLGFALVYTGRGEAVRSWWFRMLLGGMVLTALVLVTNPYHGLFWSGFRPRPGFGAVGATYTFGPWAFVGAALNVLTVGAATGLLFETVLSYGPLYRREAAAVGLSPVPPGLGVLAWLLGFGPAGLNLAPVLFIPHVALDVYAFVGTDMFEFYPATRRAAEQSALEAVGTPVVVVDDRGRVVQANAAAGALFGDRDARAEPLAAALGEEVDLSEPSRLTLSGGGATREFRVTPARLETTGETVGHTLVFQDVTEEVRREQRLSVLNRVLRHNLRNDLSVAMGYLEVSADRVDGDVAALLDSAHDALDGLVATGEKARLVEETVRQADAEPRPVDLSALAAETAERFRASFPAATVTVDAGRVGADGGDAAADAAADSGGGVVVVTNEALVSAVLDNLVENACLHGGAAPTVRVEVAATPGGARLTVADDGPGIPQHELETLAADRETDLEHGSGLGLWIVRWGAELLGADLAFETDDGTTVVLEVPARAETATLN